MTLSANKLDKFSFQELQYAFTRHMRDPEKEPAPEDIEDRRMEIYRGLLYRNVESFMANNFPVIRKITQEDQWHDMIRDYFRTHQARTPLFPKMPQEFLQYLKEERKSSTDFPFLKELAHYEWIEAAISLDAREINMEAIDGEGNLLEGVPVLSPLAWPLAYQYPVHKISPQFLPDEPPPQATYIIVYRNRQDEVGFLELNPVSAKLIEYLSAGEKQNGRELLQTIAKELNHPDINVVIEGGAGVLNLMKEKDIILGTRQT